MKKTENKKEIVSFNEVTRDVASLLELDDTQLDTVLGGMLCSINDACTDRFGCKTLC